MYLDFDDHRPDTPHLPPVLSRLERLLMTVVAYLVIVIAYLVLPASWFERPELDSYLTRPQQDDVRFVMMEPMREVPALPPPKAEPSDRDRRAATPERPPLADNPEPVSRGNTPEKVEGGPPADPPRGDRGDVERAPPPPDAPAVLPEPAAPPAKAPGEGLADSLRNLQRFLNSSDFSNPTGGDTQQDAQISFDSRGVDFGWWLRRFVAHVKSNWFIPQSAMVLKGRVVITLLVHRNGTITDVEVIQPSPHPALDLAAVNALRGSNPTVALPAEYPEDKVLFTVTFLYNMR